MPFDSFVDGIQVNLPNGLSVGVFQISQTPGAAQAPASGNSGSYAQMLQSVEQLVAAFANAPGAAANGAVSASPESLPGAANLAPGQSVDGIDVALPNGYSAEIYGIEQGSAGTASGSGGTPQTCPGKAAAAPGHGGRVNPTTGESPPFDVGSP